MISPLHITSTWMWNTLSSVFSWVELIECIGKAWLLWISLRKHPDVFWKDDLIMETTNRIATGAHFLMWLSFYRILVRIQLVSPLYRCALALCVWHALTWSAVLRFSLTFKNFLTCAIVSLDEQRMYFRTNSFTGCSSIELSLLIRTMQESVTIRFFHTQTRKKHYGSYLKHSRQTPICGSSRWKFSLLSSSPANSFTLLTAGSSVVESGTGEVRIYWMTSNLYSSKQSYEVGIS